MAKSPNIDPNAVPSSLPEKGDEGDFRETKSSRNNAFHYLTSAIARLAPMPFFSSERTKQTAIAAQELCAAL